jgi:hypothetical protein
VLVLREFAAMTFALTLRRGSGSGSSRAKKLPGDKS